jgi:penicillin-binding protein 1A
VSGGTVPAQIWRNFMTSAIAVDGRRGPELPADFRRGGKPKQGAETDRYESPIPPEWSNGTKPLRELVHSFEQWIDQL